MFEPREGYMFLDEVRCFTRTCDKAYQKEGKRHIQTYYWFERYIHSSLNFHVSRIEFSVFSINQIQVIVWIESFHSNCNFSLINQHLLQYIAFCTKWFDSCYKAMKAARLKFTPYIFFIEVKCGHYTELNLKYTWMRNNRTIGFLFFFSWYSPGNIKGNISIKWGKSKRKEKRTSQDRRDQMIPKIKLLFGLALTNCVLHWMPLHRYLIFRQQKMRSNYSFI